MSLAMNSLVKIPFGLPCKSLVVLNISANKLKSFVGLEQCTNLKLINASKNQLSSLAGIQQLTGMKELYLGSNYLTSLSEIKNLQLTHLDVSYNRLSDFDQLKVLSAQIISLTGNSVASLRDFNF
jgi:Leucine-rich repeat (LRR) protein